MTDAPAPAWPDPERVSTAAWAAARLYERAPNGEGLMGAVSRMAVGIDASLNGACEDDAVRAGLDASMGYGAPPFPEPWVRADAVAAQVAAARRAALEEAAAAAHQVEQEAP